MNYKEQATRALVQKTVAEIWEVAQQAQREKCAEALRKIPPLYEDDSRIDNSRIALLEFGLAIETVLNAK